MDAVPFPGGVFSHESQSERFKSQIRVLKQLKTDRFIYCRLFTQLKHFLIDAWLDIVILLVIGAVAVVVWILPHTFTRLFPVTFAASGDIVYPTIAYPYIKPIFSSTIAGITCALIPAGVILVSQIWIRSFLVASNAILGLSYSMITGTLFQVMLKNTIGGLRPHFLSICQPVLPSVASGSGVVGQGFQNVMWTVDQVCTGDKAKIKNALESFPSGHAQIAFSGMGFLVLYLFAHLRIRVSARRRPSYWRMLFVVAPICVAVYLASTLVLGYHHHWYDVAFGALIGMLMACFGYRMVFAGLWDPNQNTLPLVRGNANADGNHTQPMNHKNVERSGRLDDQTIQLQQGVPWKVKTNDSPV